MRKLCLFFSVFFVSLLSFLLSSVTPGYAELIPGTNCQKLTPVKLSVTPDSGKFGTDFKVTVHWEDLTTDDERKAWQALGGNYHVAFYGDDNSPFGGNILKKPVPSDNKPVELTFDKVFANSPILAVHIGPGDSVDVNCEKSNYYQSGSAGINYDVETNPTPTPPPASPTPDNCPIRGKDCTYDASICGACEKYSCQTVLSGGLIGRDRRACKPIPPPTPTPEEGQLKLGDACDLNKASTGVATFKCESGIDCVLTDFANQKGICGGPEAVDLANRCNTSIDTTRPLKGQIGPCAPYRDDSIGRTTEDTLTEVRRCGVKSSGFVCKNPEAQLCLVKATEDATVEDLRCQAVPPAKSPCKEGLDLDGNPTTTPALIVQCTVVSTAIGDIQTTPLDFLKRLMGIILSLSGGIALLLIIYAGYEILRSEGNPEKVQGAKDTITSAIIGLVFMIFSMVILQLIGVDILHIPILSP